jgi:hypothetical protein
LVSTRTALKAQMQAFKTMRMPIGEVSNETSGRQNRLRQCGASFGSPAAVSSSLPEAVATVVRRTRPTSNRKMGQASTEADDGPPPSKLSKMLASPPMTFAANGGDASNSFRGGSGNAARLLAGESLPRRTLARDGGVQRQAAENFWA